MPKFGGELWHLLYLEAFLHLETSSWLGFGVSQRFLECLLHHFLEGESYPCKAIMEGMGDGKKRKLGDETNGASDPLSEEDLKQLLVLLSREQLVNLLTNAGIQYPAIADEIRDVASKDPAHRKLFVRGLAWETSSQTLREAFEQYGDIEEGAVIIDKLTGKSRGFGFITFKHMDSAQRALKEPSKTIDGRITVCNLATAGTNPTQGSDQSQRKLYIGGLSYETSNEALISMFSQYGDIEEGSVAYDKNTNKSRGFAFVTFKTVEAAKRALEEPNKSIDGRVINVKLAVEGQKEKPATQHTPAQHVQMVPQVQGRIAASNWATPGTNQAQGSDQSQRKLYVGGLSFDTTNETLISKFLQYGAIEEGSVAYDKNTNKSRGFAFVTFKTAEAAKRALEEPIISIDGRTINVKLAVEGQKYPTQTTPGQQVQMLPQVQTGYAAVYPNLSSYPRPQVAAPVSTIGFQAYPTGFPAYAPQTYVAQPAYGPAFATQPAYAGLSGAQIAAVAPPPYTTPQYAAFQTGQAGQSGMPMPANPAGVGVPPYYG